MKIDITVDMKQVLKDLKTLGIKVRTFNSKVLRPAATMLAKAIRENAPVGKTGQLKKSIKAKSVKGVYQVGSFIEPSERAQGKGAYYAAMVEFGTVKLAAKPFMQPIVDAKTKEVNDMTKKATLEFIEKEFAK